MTLATATRWSVEGTVEAFGLAWAGQLPLEHGWAVAPAGDERTICIAVEDGRCGTPDDSDLQRTPMWVGMIDGQPFHATELGDGRLMMEHASVGTFVLSDDGRRLSCWPVAAAPTVAFGRTLLDSVMFSCALARDVPLLHAGAVVVDGAAVAVCGQSGSGKSSLCNALLDAGGDFLTDDILALTIRADASPIAHAGAPAATLPDVVTPRVDDRILADLDGERWVARPVGVSAVPLRGIVLLDAGDGPGIRDAAFAELLAHVMLVPQIRVPAIFEAAGSVYSTVRVGTLSQKSEPPAELAQRVLAWMRELA